MNALSLYLMYILKSYLVALFSVCAKAKLKSMAVCFLTDNFLIKATHVTSRDGTPSST